MKRLWKTAKKWCGETVDTCRQMYGRTHFILSGNCGEGFIDQAISILIAVVIGALLLAGLYALFGEVVLPTLTQRIKEMFDYAG